MTDLYFKNTHKTIEKYMKKYIASHFNFIN